MVPPSSNRISRVPPYLSQAQYHTGHFTYGVLFAFPSRYLFTIGRQEYLALEGGPPSFTHERPSTRYSGGQPRSLIALSYGALTLYGLPFQAGSPNNQIFDFAWNREVPEVDSYNTGTATAPAYHAVAVWAPPFSLATTGGIIFILFSTGYLDVSVPRVSFLYRYRIIRLQRIRLSHSEI